MTMLDIRGLTVEFKTRGGIVHAVRGVDLQLNEGGLLGIAGESGCGKTTSAMSIPRLLQRNAAITGGQIFFNGEDLAVKTEKQMQEIRWKRISVVFQGAMNALNPLNTVGAQIMEPILLHEPETTKKQAEERSKLLLERVGIAAARGAGYPHEFSGGMRQRVMIAMALACNPQLVIADEPVTALDVMIQAQILQLLRELSGQYKLSMIMISHDLSVLSELCDRIAIMYAGRMVEYGSAREVFSRPAHPYTVRLMQSYPNIYGERTFLHGIPGYPPSLLSPPPGCPFSSRCAMKKSRCEETEPEIFRVAGDHYCACPEVIA